MLKEWLPLVLLLFLFPTSLLCSVQGQVTCGAGFEVYNGTSCVPCGVGYFSDGSANSSSCLACSQEVAPGSTTRNTGSTSMASCFCPEGFFLQEGTGGAAAGSAGECALCPPVVRDGCEERNASTRSLHIRAGWWRTHETSLTFVPCSPLACDGGTTDGDYKDDDDNDDDDKQNPSVCAEGHRGPTCALCEEGYASDFGAGCGPCGGDAAAHNAAISAAIIGFVLLHLGGLAYYVTTQSRRLAQGGGDGGGAGQQRRKASVTKEGYGQGQRITFEFEARRSSSGDGASWVQAPRRRISQVGLISNPGADHDFSPEEQSRVEAIWAKVRVLILFAQTLALLPDAFHASAFVHRESGAAGGFFRGLTMLFSFDWFTIFCTSCTVSSSHAVRVLVNISAVLGETALVLLLLGGGYFIYNKGRNKKFLGVKNTLIFSLVLFLMLNLVPLTARAALGLAPCIHVHDLPTNTNVDATDSFIPGAAAVDCADSDEYANTLLACIPVFLLCTALAGSALGHTILSQQKLHDLEQQTGAEDRVLSVIMRRSALIGPYIVLWCGLRVQAYWFAAIELLFAQLLLGIGALIAPGSFAQLSLGVLICAAFCAAIAKTQPYADHATNLLALFGGVVVLTVLMLFTVLRYYAVDTLLRHAAPAESLRVGLLADKSGSSSTFSLAEADVTMCVLMVAFFVAWVALLIWKIVYPPDWDEYAGSTSVSAATAPSRLSIAGDSYADSGLNTDVGSTTPRGAGGHEYFRPVRRDSKRKPTATAAAVAAALEADNPDNLQEAEEDDHEQSDAQHPRDGGSGEGAGEEQGNSGVDLSRVASLLRAKSVRRQGIRMSNEPPAADPDYGVDAPEYTGPGQGAGDDMEDPFSPASASASARPMLNQEYMKRDPSRQGIIQGGPQGRPSSGHDMRSSAHDQQQLPPETGSGAGIGRTPKSVRTPRSPYGDPNAGNAGTPRSPPRSPQQEHAFDFDAREPSFGQGELNLTGSLPVSPTRPFTSTGAGSGNSSAVNSRRQSRADARRGSRQPGSRPRSAVTPVDGSPGTGKGLSGGGSSTRKRQQYGTGATASTASAFLRELEKSKEQQGRHGAGAARPGSAHIPREMKFGITSRTPAQRGNQASGPGRRRRAGSAPDGLEVLPHDSPLRPGSASAKAREAQRVHKREVAAVRTGRSLSQRQGSAAAQQRRHDADELRVVQERNSHGGRDSLSYCDDDIVVDDIMPAAAEEPSRPQRAPPPRPNKDPSNHNRSKNTAARGARPRSAVQQEPPGHRRTKTARATVGGLASVGGSFAMPTAANVLTQQAQAAAGSQRGVGGAAGGGSSSGPPSRSQQPGRQGQQYNSARVAAPPLRSPQQRRRDRL